MLNSLTFSDYFEGSIKSLHLSQELSLSSSLKSFGKLNLIKPIYSDELEFSIFKRYEGFDLLSKASILRALLSYRHFRKMIDDLFIRNMNVFINDKTKAQIELDNYAHAIEKLNYKYNEVIRSIVSLVNSPSINFVDFIFKSKTVLFYMLAFPFDCIPIKKKETILFAASHGISTKRLCDLYTSRKKRLREYQTDANKRPKWIPDHISHEMVCDYVNGDLLCLTDHI